MGISSKVEVVDGGSFLGFPLIPKWVGGEVLQSKVRLLRVTFPERSILILDISRVFN